MKNTLQTSSSGRNRHFVERAEILRDLDDWMALVERVQDNFPGMELASYQETLIRNMERGSALCVRVDGRMAGVLLYSRKHGCLSFMAVEPDFRRQGIGSALIRKMLEEMDGPVWVDTFREEDPLGEAPRALYPKMGFAPGQLHEEAGRPVQRFWFMKGREEA